MSEIEITKEDKIKHLKETISDLEVGLERYKKQLQSNPDSIFNEGLVKNRSEWIEELKEVLNKLESEE